ncbi:MAG: PadR family transcriptional regulator [Pseudomonadota bacterium]
MALGDAILVCLAERAMSGYDLAKWFDASIGFFWSASHPQIYRELRRLREAGFVEAEEIAQSGKPNRIEYSLTEAGRTALLDWSREPVESPALKDDLLVRFYALDHVDPEALREQLLTRRAQHEDRLRRYEKIRAQHYEGRALSRSERGKRLGLDLGIRYEKGWIAWCDEALGEI